MKVIEKLNSLLGLQKKELVTWDVYGMKEACISWEKLLWKPLYAKVHLILRHSRTIKDARKRTRDFSSESFVTQWKRCPLTIRRKKETLYFGGKWIPISMRINTKCFYLHSLNVGITVVNYQQVSRVSRLSRVSTDAFWNYVVCFCSGKTRETKKNWYQTQNKIIFTLIFI